MTKELIRQYGFTASLTPKGIYEGFGALCVKGNFKGRLEAAGQFHFQHGAN